MALSIEEMRLNLEQDALDRRQERLNRAHRRRMESRANAIESGLSVGPQERAEVMSAVGRDEGTKLRKHELSILDKQGFNAIALQDKVNAGNLDVATMNGLTQREIALINQAGASKIAELNNASAEKIAGINTASAEKIAGTKLTEVEKQIAGQTKIAEIQADSAESIAEMNTKSQERIAEKNAVSSGVEKALDRETQMKIAELKAKGELTTAEVTAATYVMQQKSVGFEEALKIVRQTRK